MQPPQRQPAGQPPSSGDAPPQCYLMDCRLAECYPLPPSPRMRAHPYAYGVCCSVIALGRHVFILPVPPFCPKTWGEPLCFDVGSRRWCTQPPPMVEPRAFFASAIVYGGYVYAAGGQGGLYYPSLKSAERFDLTSKKWERIPDMREQRHEALGVAWKGSFCVLGGSNYVLSENGMSGNNISVNSAEVWNASKEEWQLISDFFPFHMHNAATVKGKLYALKDVLNDWGYHERVLMLWDEKTNRWTVLGSLEDAVRGYAQVFFQARDSGSMMEVGDELWILVEVYTAYKCAFFATDPESRPLCWRYIPFNFYTHRRNVCVVTF